VNITPDLIRQIMPLVGARADTYAAELSLAMTEVEINTPQRASCFLAQVAHESGQLKYTRELASGIAYEGRADLGNTVPGDGPFFKGRGFLQVTGRGNYGACGLALKLDLVAHPELLETPSGACRSAGWFWRKNALSDYSDKDAFGGLTKRINGGYNGLDERIQFWLRARKSLGL
jgi:putative chitinase